MDNISFNLSGKIDKPIIEALSVLKTVADSLGVTFFVVGASARDIVLQHGYGIDVPRMTRDIDLGVEVADWEQFKKLEDSLISTGKFLHDKKEQQRFHFDSVMIDIIPFGPITDENKQFSWPPEHEIFMSMSGFKEAYEYSMTVRLSSTPVLDIRVPTLAGLAILKLISWKEKYPERKKDAEDLLLIMNKYENAGNLDRLYSDKQVLLQEEKFDTVLAGIRLLGEDMAAIAAPDTLEAVLHILDDEMESQSPHKLVIHMTIGARDFDDKFGEIFLKLEKLRKGLGGLNSLV